MLTKADLLAALGTRLSEPDLVEVKPGVYRATLSYAGHAYSVHYFDITKPFSSDGFDIERYQNDLLAEDYYANPGSLQWNYYLNFVVTDSEIVDPTIIGKRLGIEDNRALARKSIASISQVRQFFVEPVSASSEIPQDFRDVWLAKLLPAGLGEVIDKSVAMDNVVDRHLSASAVPKTSAKTPRFDPVEKFPRIRKLKLVEFRLYPQEPREFVFAPMNLVYGPNASGKTSLLEAIELSVCGGTRRNPDSQEQFVFDLTFEGKKDVTRIVPLTDKEYRDRGASWYGRTYPKENELAKSFARFNFFDTDAAARFADEVDEGNFGEALKSIVFGTDAQILEKRLHGIQDRFEATERGATAKRNSAQTEVAIARQKVEQLKKIDTSTISLNLLHSRMTEAGFRSEALVERGEDLAKIVFALTQSLRITAAPENTLANYTIRDIRSRYARDVQIREDLTALESTRTSIEEKRRAADLLLRSCEQRTAVTERLKKYEENGAWILATRQVSYQEIDRQVANLRAIANEFEALDLSRFKDADVLTEKLVERAQALKVHQSEESKLKTRMVGMAQSEKRIQLLSQEIRDKAHELLALLPDLAECPVCGTKHTSPTLGNALQSKDKSSEQTDPEMRDLSLANQSVSAQVRGTSAEVEALENLRDFVVRLA